jgi:hypothetical protein
LAAASFSGQQQHPSAAELRIEDKMVILGRTLEEKLTTFISELSMKSEALLNRVQKMELSLQAVDGVVSRNNSRMNEEDGMGEHHRTLVDRMTKLETAQVEEMEHMMRLQLEVQELRADVTSMRGMIGDESAPQHGATLLVPPQSSQHLTAAPLHRLSQAIDAPNVVAADENQRGWSPSTITGGSSYTAHWAPPELQGPTTSMSSTKQGGLGSPHLRTVAPGGLDGRDVQIPWRMDPHPRQESVSSSNEQHAERELLARDAHLLGWLQDHLAERDARLRQDLERQYAVSSIPSRTSSRPLQDPSAPLAAGHWDASSQSGLMSGPNMPLSDRWTRLSGPPVNR